MLPEQRLRQVLLSLPRRTLHGPWSRSIEFGYLHRPSASVSPSGAPVPLWAEGPVRYGARFTPPGGCGTIYRASDVITALAEVQNILYTPGQPLTLVDRRPWTLVAVEGVLADVLDLTDPEIQAQLGTSLQELTGLWRYGPPNQLAPTQILGRAAYDSGVVTGLLYVSARSPAGRCIAVFADRLVAERPSFLAVADPSGYVRQRLPPRTP